MISLVLPVINIISLGYLMVAIIKIRKRKLYLEITNGILRFKGIIYERQLVISNIGTIKKISGARRMESIVIKARIESSSNNSNIKIPLIWFSDRDIDFLLDQIRKHKTHITWNGF